MSSLTDEQVKALNEWARTQPALRRVFPYTQGSNVDALGLGTALDSGAETSTIDVKESDGNPPTFDTDTLIFSSEAFYLTPNSAGKPTVNFRPSAGGVSDTLPGFYGIVVRESDLTYTHRDDTLEFLSSDFDLSTVDGKPRVALGKIITAEAFYLADGGDLGTTAKHITLQYPTSQDTITWFKAVESGFVVEEMHSFLRTGDGGFYPSVRFTVRHGTALPSRFFGSELTTDGWRIGFYPNNSTLTENPLTRTVFTNPNIAQNSWVTLLTLGLGEGTGTEEELHVTLRLRRTT